MLNLLVSNRSSMLVDN